MLYYTLKIFHILSATTFLTSLAYCFTVWRHMTYVNKETSIARIQSQTDYILLPTLLFQLISGFTLISVQYHTLSAFWIKGSIIGFIVVVSTWFSFLYTLSLSQNTARITSLVSSKQLHREKSDAQLRKLQTALLAICGLALCTMIFCMTEKMF